MKRLDGRHNSTCLGLQITTPTNTTSSPTPPHKCLFLVPFCPLVFPQHTTSQSPYSLSLRSTMEVRLPLPRCLSVHHTTNLSCAAYAVPLSLPLLVLRTWIPPPLAPQPAPSLPRAADAEIPHRPGRLLGVLRPVHLGTAHVHIHQPDREPPVPRRHPDQSLRRPLTRELADATPKEDAVYGVGPSTDGPFGSVGGFDERRVRAQVDVETTRLGFLVARADGVDLDGGIARK